MQVWLGADGRLRGVVSLDAVTSDEFCEAFRRWPVCLRQIEAADLDRAVYAMVGPGVIAAPERGGYQAVKFTLKVASALKGEGYRASQASPPENTIEPMPCLFA
jgi:hypothetical protein